jgi:hypothetical protein
VLISAPAAETSGLRLAPAMPEKAIEATLQPVSTEPAQGEIVPTPAAAPNRPADAAQLTASQPAASAS